MIPGRMQRHVSTVEVRSRALQCIFLVARLKAEACEFNHGARATAFPKPRWLRNIVVLSDSPNVRHLDRIDRGGSQNALRPRDVVAPQCMVDMTKNYPRSADHHPYSALGRAVRGRSMTRCINC